MRNLPIEDAMHRIEKLEDILSYVCMHGDIPIKRYLIEQEINLNIFIHDKNPSIRAFVASKGHNLDYFINDDDYEVRMLVAEQGYGLDILINDKNSLVSEIAKNYILSNKEESNEYKL